MTDYQDIWYQSTDGLRLYTRDYANDNAAITLLCMHGLTRNSADFSGLCEWLQPRYRLIAVDQRGRGRSAYDPNPGNYDPGVYVQDMFTLLDQLALQRVVLVGTSLGGLMTMLMASMQPQRVQAAILNDIGPVLDPAGLERIKNYVGKGAKINNWQDAVAETRSVNGIAFPDWQDADWLRFARNLYRETSNGTLELAYDPAIAQPILQDQNNAVPPDLWPAFEALADIPTLVVRGALSDILSAQCLQDMQARKPDLRCIEIAARGHAPTLDEPAARAAIDEFLATIEAGH